MSHSWCLQQLDFQNAFLHGLLTDTVYMQQAQGFIDPSQPHHVCKLHKAIYSLKQAPRAWFDQLSSWLLSYGFKASQADPSLFIFHLTNTYIYFSVYIDDIVVTATHPQAVDRLISALSIAFLVKDLGQLSYFLGVEVDHTPSDIHLSQHKYIKELLIKRFCKVLCIGASWVVCSTYLSLD